MLAAPSADRRVKQHDPEHWHYIEQHQLFEASGQWQALPAALYLWVPDVDATYEAALAAGATSQSAPEDKPYGHRSGGVVDANGITWWVASPIA